MPESKNSGEDELVEIEARALRSPDADIPPGVADAQNPEAKAAPDELDEPVDPGAGGQPTFENEPTADETFVRGDLESSPGYVKRA